MKRKLQERIKTTQSKMVRDKTRVKVGIPNLTTKEEEIIQDDKRKDSLFNSFISFFTNEDK